MRKLLILAVFSIPFIFFFSCKHDTILPEEQVSFVHDIQPIIRGSCQHSGCHDTVGTGQFPLNTYQQVEDQVDAGRPDHSELYERITSTDDSEIMPRDPYEPLSDRQIRLIYIWIAQGAKDN